MPSCRVALVVLIVLMGDHASAKEVIWILAGTTVGELTAQCPATFGSKPIESYSPEYRAGLNCFVTIFSLIDYLDRTGRICFLPADVQEYQKDYSAALKAIGKAAKKRPDATLQSIVEPVLRKRYPCP